MQNINLTDTIAAVATAVGESGIGIVRISGKDALRVADKIFLSKDGKRASTFKAYTTHYGWIVSRLSGKPVSRLASLSRHTGTPAHRHTEIIDEVLLTVMRGPKSYTKEDVVEINCHGGIVALRAALDLVLENGCRLAEPGEFTRRAFLNGRIDLAQAEAVLDIIRARTDSALKISAEQLRGGVSKQINKMRNRLLELASHLEADIDFPGEELDAAGPQQIREGLQEVGRQCRDILEGARRGRIFREGIQVVICGKPNVGKSSLLNALLKQERSIVTPVAGTTRDTIEEVIDIKGIPVRIVDTAGIIEPRDLVEKKAVLRSKRYIGLADLVILLLDGSRPLAKDDEALARKLKKKAIIAVVNKIDLKQKIDKGKILKRFPSVVGISAKKLKNIDLLEQAIANLVYAGGLRTPESALVSNLRHIEAVRHAEKFIAQALNSLDNELSLEFIAQEIREALGYLDEILGRRFSEELLDKIFSEFCVGK